MQDEKKASTWYDKLKRVKIMRNLDLFAQKHCAADNTKSGAV